MHDPAGLVIVTATVPAVSSFTEPAVSQGMDELGVGEHLKHLRYLVVRHQAECGGKGVGDRRRWRFDADLPPHRGGPPGSRIKNVTEASGRVEGRAKRF